MDFLKKNTSREGRILLEDSESSSYTPEQYYGGHFPGLFPEHLRRDYLCGPRALYPLRHSYASFNSGELFDRDISRYRPSEIKSLFDTFNVRWIICWSQKANDFFSRFPDYVLKMTRIDKFSIY